MVGPSRKGFSYREAIALARGINQEVVEMTAGTGSFTCKKRMRCSQFDNNLRTKRK